MAKTATTKRYERLSGRQPSDRLNERQSKFVDGIVKGMTQYEAYMAAGYKVKNADHAMSNASTLIRNPKVEKELQRRLERAEKSNRQRMAFAANQAIEELIKLADFSTPSTQLNAIKDILDRTGYKPTDKHEHEITGNQQITIINSIPLPPDDQPDNDTPGE